jgi:hypothetical protein
VTEGVVTDPVCASKALAAISEPALEPPIIFWHTGGSSALFSDELGMAMWTIDERGAEPEPQE